MSQLMKQHKYVDFPPKIYVDEQNYQKEYIRSSGLFSSFNSIINVIPNNTLPYAAKTGNRYHSTNYESNFDPSFSNPQSSLNFVTPLEQNDPKFIQDFLHGVDALYKLATSSLGPLGSSQILKLGVGGFGNVLVTCGCQQILRHIEMRGSLERILVNIATNQSILLDYSWEFLYTACKLIKISKEWPMHWSNAIFYWLQQKISQFFQDEHDEKIRINLIEDVEIYIGLLNSTFTSSYLLMSISEEDRIHISLQLVQAFLGALPDNLNPKELKKPNVKVLTQLGLPTKKSHFIDGILLNIPIPLELSILFKNSIVNDASIIMYKLPLQLETIVKNYDHLQKTSEDSKVKIIFEFEDDSVNQSEDLEHMAMKMYREWVKALCSLNVRVVCSQKTIHPFVKVELSRHGILPLERLSIIHLEAFREISNASILGEISTIISPDAIGNVHKLCIKTINETTYLQLLQSSLKSNDKYKTIIIGAQSPFMEAELQRLSEKSLNIMYQMLFHPYVVLGGSNLELRLFKFLEKSIQEEICKDGLSASRCKDAERTIFGLRITKSEEKSIAATRKKLEKRIREAISVFQSYSLTLLKSEEIVSKIESDLSMTYDLLLGDYCDTVFDFWISKKRCIEEAVQVASLISRIGSVIEVQS